MFSCGNVPIDLDQILYFGDIDVNGLKIPANASQNAVTVGLPVVKPATSLYTALLSRGQRQPHTRVSLAAAEAAARWLPGVLHSQVIDVLAAGKRVARRHRPRVPPQLRRVEIRSRLNEIPEVEPHQSSPRTTDQRVRLPRATPAGHGPSVVCGRRIPQTRGLGMGSLWFARDCSCVLSPTEESVDTIAGQRHSLA